MTRTCQACIHNDNGICDLVGYDMYEFRHVSPSDGGCGIYALKFQPKYPVEEEVESLYLWT